MPDNNPAPKPIAAAVRLFAGGHDFTLPDGTQSGMGKSAVSNAQVASTGLTGDFQADRRVHGGEFKALHHLPGEHYTSLGTQFPALAANLRPGHLGENISTTGVLEHEVFLGDIWKLGTVVLQVTQPRRPCWKIDARLDARGVAAFVHQNGICGWYYRVLQPGEVASGDVLRLIRREPGTPSIAQFHQTCRKTRPAPADLEAWAELTVLPPDLRRRLSERAEWLRRNR